MLVIPYMSLCFRARRPSFATVHETGQGAEHKGTAASTRKKIVLSPEI